MSSISLQTFIAIMRLTQSDNDGEALSAIRRANRCLQDLGTGWDQVISFPAQGVGACPQEIPPPEGMGGPVEPLLPPVLGNWRDAINWMASSKLGRTAEETAWLDRLALRQEAAGVRPVLEWEDAYRVIHIYEREAL